MLWNVRRAIVLRVQLAWFAGLCLLATGALALRVRRAPGRVRAWIR